MVDQRLHKVQVDLLTHVVASASSASLFSRAFLLSRGLLTFLLMPLEVACFGCFTGFLDVLVGAIVYMDRVLVI